MRSLLLESLKQKPVQPIPKGPFVFLSGTVGENNWREQLIPMLTVASFNPVVADWSKDDYLNEEIAKQEASILLFVIAPDHQGPYSFVEAAVAACKVCYLRQNKRAILTVLDSLTNDDQRHSLAAIDSLLQKETNIQIYTTLEDTAKAINQSVL